MTDNKWISIHRYMPNMHRHYCGVTSAYQSQTVRVKTFDGDEYRASLQLYGNNLDGWKSEWWNNGMLSDRTEIKGVVCWKESGIITHDTDTTQTFEETIGEHEKWVELKSNRKESR